MNLKLLLPGLIWPGANTPGMPDVTAGLALPSLERMLGSGKVTIAPRSSYLAELGRLFGVPDPLPVGRLRRLGEANRPEQTVEDSWLCADPVHLHFAREHLLLSDASGLEITPEEADALIDTINQFISAEEPALAGFERGAPDRWYLRLPADSVPAQFHPLEEAVGRPVSRFLPEGDQARRWQQIANEIQVLLHNHPVNQAREENGWPAINSIWFWGEDRDAPGSVGSDRSLGSTEPIAPTIEIHADEPVARGLAIAAGLTPLSVRQAPEGDARVVIDTLHRPALQLDLEGWRGALQALEQDWFAPLLEQVRNGTLKSVELIAPGDRASVTLTLTRADTWKFWRRPRTLRSLTPPDS